MTTRHDGRSSDALRPVRIELGVQRNPEGSVLYRCGGTTVLISASVSESVPDWMRDRGTGWVTAEYAMHPRSTEERQRGKRYHQDGRATEIKRLIGRALRSAVDMEKLGPRMVTLDCDVLDADGGTRTASITGGWIALALALSRLKERAVIPDGVLRAQVAAISVGLVEERPLLDLCYLEDRDAQVDLNVVGTTSAGVVEVQGTAEGAPMSRPQLDALVDLGLGALGELGKKQREALSEIDLARLLAAG